MGNSPTGQPEHGDGHHGSCRSSVATIQGSWPWSPPEGPVPLMPAGMAVALGMPVVLIPAAAGVASAIGLLSADVKFDVPHALSSPDSRDLGSGTTHPRSTTRWKTEASRVIEESTDAKPVRMVREKWTSGMWARDSSWQSRSPKVP